MRIKVDYRMASRENYKRFKEDNSSSKLSYMEWGNIIYSFNYMMRDYALETGKVTKLPWGLGEIVISKRRRKKFITLPNGEEKVNLAVDWQKTKKAGKWIYHMNDHTSGFSFKWKWFPRRAKFKYHKLWVFKPSRVSSRLLKHYITEGYSNKYYEWELIRK